MIVRADRDIDVMQYNPYQLEHVNVEECQLGPREKQYVIEFIIREGSESTTTDLLFNSGCVFEPPALVRGEYELQTVLAATAANVTRLIRNLEERHRDYRVLSLRETEPQQKLSPPVAWSGLLTPKQLTAIRVAFRDGFYRYPRKIRIADLAKHAGSARSTFQEHLRLAEIRLIRYLLQTETPGRTVDSEERRPRPKRREAPREGETADPEY